MNQEQTVTISIKLLVRILVQFTRMINLVDAIGSTDIDLFKDLYEVIAAQDEEKDQNENKH